MSDSAPESTPTPENTESQETTEKVEETKEASAPASSTEAPAAIKAEAKKAADKLDAEKIPGTKTYKLVVHGKERIFTEEQMIARAQKAEGADLSFQESAQIKKEAQQLIKMLRDSPESVLADPALLGSPEKVIEFAQKVLARRLEDEAKSPEVLRAEKAEAELEKLRKESKDKEEKSKQEEFDRYVSQQETQMEEQIQEALEVSGLPKKPFVLKRLADVMISSLENDKEITPKQALSIVKKEMYKDFREFADVSPDDIFEQLMASERAKTYRKSQVAKMKAESIPSINQVKEVKTSESTPKKSDKISMKKWLRG